jgi:hypothetical protein
MQILSSCRNMGGGMVLMLMVLSFLTVNASKGNDFNVGDIVEVTQSIKGNDSTSDAEFEIGAYLFVYAIKDGCLHVEEIKKINTENDGYKYINLALLAIDGINLRIHQERSEMKKNDKVLVYSSYSKTWVPAVIQKIGQKKEQKKITLSYTDESSNTVDYATPIIPELYKDLYSVSAETETQETTQGKKYTVKTDSDNDKTLEKDNIDEKIGWSYSTASTAAYTVYNADNDHYDSDMKDELDVEKKNLTSGPTDTALNNSSDKTSKNNKRKAKDMEEENNPKTKISKLVTLAKKKDEKFEDVVDNKTKRVVNVGYRATIPVWNTLLPEAVAAHRSEKASENIGIQWKFYGDYDFTKEMQEKIKSNIKQLIRDGVFNSQHPEGKKDVRICKSKSVVGEKGLCATDDLEPGEVIGLFNGKMYTREEIDNGSIRLSRERYLMSMEIPTSKYNFPENQVYIDPFQKSGKVNDCRKKIKCKLTEKDKKRLNMIWIEFDYQGFRYIAEVIIKPIRSGEEILTYYGDKYQCAENKKRNKIPHSEWTMIEFSPEMLENTQKLEKEYKNYPLKEKAAMFHNISYDANGQNFRCYYDMDTGPLEKRHVSVYNNQDFGMCIIGCLAKLKKYPHQFIGHPPNIAQVKITKKETENLKERIEKFNKENNIPDREKADEETKISQASRFYGVSYHKSNNRFTCSYREGNKTISFGRTGINGLTECILKCQDR